MTFKFVSDKEGDIGKLFDAIGRASKSFQPVPKNKSGQVGTQTFQYASFLTIMKCIRPALLAEGITIAQLTHSEGDKAAITLVVSGHGASIESTFTFPGEFKKKQKDGREVHDAQEFGKNHTYYRRYQLQSFFCLEGDKDVDDPVEHDDSPSETVPVKESANVKAPAVEQRSANEAVEKADKVDPPAKPAGGPAQPQMVQSLNQKLISALEQLKWSMSDCNEFAKDLLQKYKVTSSNKLPDAGKQELWERLTTEKGVAPF